MRPTLFLFVAIGGAIGSVARYAITYATHARSATTFPVATLAVNIAGSLLLGFIARYTMDSTALSAETRLLLTVGFCGGFTTFSTFTYETVRLVEDGALARAGVYAALSFVLAIAGFIAGSALARALLAARTGV